MMRILVLLISFSATQIVLSWNNHADMTISASKEWIKSSPFIAHKLNQSIPIESLEHFLNTTKQNLPNKLKTIEKMLNRTEEGYRPLLKNITYDPNLVIAEIIWSCVLKNLCVSI